MTRWLTQVGALAVAVVTGLAAVAVAAQDGVREVSVSAHTLVPLQTRLRYTTMIVLPG